MRGAPFGGGEKVDSLMIFSKDEKERIFLNGQEVENVLAYKLENTAGETAKLTISMLVKAGQVAFESEKR